MLVMCMYMTKWCILINAHLNGITVSWFSNDVNSCLKMVFAGFPISVVFEGNPGNWYPGEQQIMM